MNSEANQPDKTNPPPFDIFMDFSKTATTEAMIPVQPEPTPESVAEVVQAETVEITAETNQAQEEVEEAQETIAPPTYELPMLSLADALLADFDSEIEEEVQEPEIQLPSIVVEDEPHQDPEGQSHPYQAPMDEAQINVEPVAQTEAVVAVVPTLPAIVPEPKVIAWGTAQKLSLAPHEPNTQDSQTSWVANSGFLIGAGVAVILAIAAILFVQHEPANTNTAPPVEVVAPIPEPVKVAVVEPAPVVEPIELHPVPNTEVPVQPQRGVEEIVAPTPKRVAPVQATVPTKTVKKVVASKPKPEREWQDDANDALDKLEKRL